MKTKTKNEIHSSGPNAVTLSEQIEWLQSQLASILGGSFPAPASTKPAKGKPTVSPEARDKIVLDDGMKVHFVEKPKPKMEYPAGSIGADLLRRNYIRYLTERYFRYREADASFGPKAVRRFSYAVLFKNVEAHFKAPTYFIPVARFDELVDFLQRKIEATILGKRNRVRGHRNYETFDEFQLTQAGD